MVYQVGRFLLLFLTLAITLKASQDAFLVNPKTKAQYPARIHVNSQRIKLMVSSGVTYNGLKAKVFTVPIGACRLSSGRTDRMGFGLLVIEDQEKNKEYNILCSSWQKSNIEHVKMKHSLNLAKALAAAQLDLENDINYETSSNEAEKERVPQQTQPTTNQHNAFFQLSSKSSDEHEDSELERKKQPMARLIEHQLQPEPINANQLPLAYAESKTNVFSKAEPSPGSKTCEIEPKVFEKSLNERPKQASVKKLPRTLLSTEVIRQENTEIEALNNVACTEVKIVEQKSSVATGNLHDTEAEPKKDSIIEATNSVSPNDAVISKPISSDKEKEFMEPATVESIAKNTTGSTEGEVKGSEKSEDVKKNTSESLEAESLIKVSVEIDPLDVKVEVITERKLPDSQVKETKATESVLAESLINMPVEPVQSSVNETAEPLDIKAEVITERKSPESQVKETKATESVVAESLINMSVEPVQTPVNETAEPLDIKAEVITELKSPESQEKETKATESVVAESLINMPVEPVQTVKNASSEPLDHMVKVITERAMPESQEKEPKTTETLVAKSLKKMPVKPVQTVKNASSEPLDDKVKVVTQFVVPESQEKEPMQPVQTQKSEMRKLRRGRKQATNCSVTESQEKIPTKIDSVQKNESKGSLDVKEHTAKPSIAEVQSIKPDRVQRAKSKTQDVKKLKIKPSIAETKTKTEPIQVQNTEGSKPLDIAESFVAVSQVKILVEPVQDIKTESIEPLEIRKNEASVDEVQVKTSVESTQVQKNKSKSLYTKKSASKVSMTVDQLQLPTEPVYAIEVERKSPLDVKVKSTEPSIAQSQAKKSVEPNSVSMVESIEPVTTRESEASVDESQVKTSGGSAQVQKPKSKSLDTKKPASKVSMAADQLQLPTEPVQATELGKQQQLLEPVAGPLVGESKVKTPIDPVQVQVEKSKSKSLEVKKHSRKKDKRADVKSTPSAVADKSKDDSSGFDIKAPAEVSEPELRPPNNASELPVQSVVVDQKPAKSTSKRSAKSQHIGPEKSKTNTPIQAEKVLSSPSIGKEDSAFNGQERGIEKNPLMDKVTETSIGEIEVESKVCVGADSVSPIVAQIEPAAEPEIKAINVPVKVSSRRRREKKAKCDKSKPESVSADIHQQNTSTSVQQPSQEKPKADVEGHVVEPKPECINSSAQQAPVSVLEPVEVLPVNNTIEVLSTEKAIEGELTAQMKEDVSVIENESVPELQQSTVPDAEEVGFKIDEFDCREVVDEKIEARYNEPESPNENIGAKNPGTGPSENEWSDIPLHSLQPVEDVHEDMAKEEAPLAEQFAFEKTSNLAPDLLSHIGCSAIEQTPSKDVAELVPLKDYEESKFDKQPEGQVEESKPEPSEEQKIVELSTEPLLPLESVEANIVISEKELDGKTNLEPENLLGHKCDSFLKQDEAAYANIEDRLEAGMSTELEQVPELVNQAEKFVVEPVKELIETHAKDNEVNSEQENIGDTLEDIPKNETTVIPEEDIPDNIGIKAEVKPEDQSAEIDSTVNPEIAHIDILVGLDLEMRDADIKAEAIQEELGNEVKADVGLNEVDTKSNIEIVFEEKNTEIEKQVDLDKQDSVIQVAVEPELGSADLNISEAIPNEEVTEFNLDKEDIEFKTESALNFPELEEAKFELEGNQEKGEVDDQYIPILQEIAVESEMRLEREEDEIRPVIEEVNSEVQKIETRPEVSEVLFLEEPTEHNEKIEEQEARTHATDYDNIFVEESTLPIAESKSELQPAEVVIPEISHSLSGNREDADFDLPSPNQEKVETLTSLDIPLQEIQEVQADCGNFDEEPTLPIAEFKPELKPVEVVIPEISPSLSGNQEDAEYDLPSPKQEKVETLTSLDISLQDIKEVKPEEKSDDAEDAARLQVETNGDTEHDQIVEGSDKPKIEQVVLPCHIAVVDVAYLNLEHVEVNYTGDLIVSSGLTTFNAGCWTSVMASRLASEASQLPTLSDMYADYFQIWSPSEDAKAPSVMGDSEAVYHLLGVDDPKIGYFPGVQLALSQLSETPFPPTQADVLTWKKEYSKVILKSSANIEVQVNAMAEYNEWIRSKSRIERFAGTQIGADSKETATVILHAPSLIAESQSLDLDEGLFSYYYSIYQQVFWMVASRHPSASTIYLSAGATGNAGAMAEAARAAYRDHAGMLRGTKVVFILGS